MPNRPKITLIVAMAENGVIGAGNRLPWHLPADLQRFRSITMGKPILMGRRTHESIGRPLPGRKNIVLTTDPAYRAEGCTVVHGIEEALREADGEEIMVIGGSALYREFLPLADRIHLTQIHRPFEGDTFFPPFDPGAWRAVERIDGNRDPTSGLEYSYVTLERAEGRG
jgi:dihydrofolate reductase